MKSIRNGFAALQFIAAFVVLLFATSVRADTTPQIGEQTEAENTENARMYSGVLCVAKTPEKEIQCGLYPLMQAIGILHLNYIDRLELTELARIANVAGIQHIGKFSYQEKRAADLDAPFPPQRVGAKFNLEGRDLRRLTNLLKPLSSALEEMRPQMEHLGLGPRAFELLLKESRDAAMFALIEKMHPHTNYYSLGSKEREK